MIAPRDYTCYYDGFDDDYVTCRRSPWNEWARWVVLAILIIGFIFLVLVCSCISARRRRRAGRAPLYGTAWMNGRHAPPTYNPSSTTDPSTNHQQQPYYASGNPYAAPAPPYSPPPPGHTYYGAPAQSAHTTGDTSFYGGGAPGSNQGYYSAPPQGGQQYGIQLHEQQPAPMSPPPAHTRPGEHVYGAPLEAPGKK